MSLIRKHVAVLQAWACLALVSLWQQLTTQTTHKKTKWHTG